MSTEKPPLDPHPLSEYVAWAGNRNRQPILGVLKEKLPKDSGRVLEMACGESLFLRKLVLGIPAQASSKNLTRPLMPPAAPIRPRHLVPTQQGVGT
ncbi:hypothetical protein BMR05_02385 [Methylococcaceae bacterium HT4]|nr:hypothetical protein BMR05_02385 [Methylococcaceae bacterium HT4]